MAGDMVVDLQRASKVEKGEEVDPQYLRILPKRLELVAPWSNLGSAVIWLKEDNETSAMCSLRQVATMDPDMSALYFGNSTERSIMDDEWKKFLTDHNLPKSFCTSSKYLWRRKCFDALSFVGLDFRGGFVEFLKTCDRARSQKDAMSMTSVLITDPEKARKYINIGIKLDSAIPQYPLSLEEAADIFAKISKCVGDHESIEHIEEKIRDPSKEKEKWAWSREKFRVEMEEKYRSILLDMAREEWLHKDLSEIRKKRARHG